MEQQTKNLNKSTNARGNTGKNQKNLNQESARSSEAGKSSGKPLDQFLNQSMKPRTSTGLPIHQDFTPPIGKSVRPEWVVPPQINVFQDIFPEESKSKRPVSTTINKSQAEVFALLQNVENFPAFFENLEKVEGGSAKQSKWYFKDESQDNYVIPMEMMVSQGQEMLAWKTEDAAGFDYTLAIHMEKAQADRGTVVRIMTSYDSKAAEMVAIFEKLFGQDAEVMAKKNLQRLKAFCETGHVPTTEGQPSGRDEDSYIIKPSPESQTLKH